MQTRCQQESDRITSHDQELEPFEGTRWKLVLEGNIVSGNEETSIIAGEWQGIIDGRSEIVGAVKWTTRINQNPQSTI